MRPVWMAAAFLAACGSSAPRQRMPDDPVARAELADEDRFVPGYGKPELQKALIAERALEATGERVVAELENTVASQDQLRVAIADLAVRRRYIAALEACESRGSWCPPRLDDPAWTFDYDADQLTAPPIDAPLRFELAGWRTIAAELYGRACACRTIVCVDSMGVAIDQLERRVAPAIQGDEQASISITRARECLFRLRGKR